MRILKRLLGLSVLVAAYLVTLSACNMPVGLGSRVNTDRPDIDIPDPDAGGGVQPGAFLSGSNNVVVLDVEVRPGVQVDHVFLTLSYTDRDGVPDQSRRIYAEKNEQTGLWQVNIDTLNPSPGMADGDVRVQITAVDEDGMTTVTTDLLYVVLNTGPQLTITVPDGLSETIDEDTRSVTGTVAFIGSVTPHVAYMHYALGVTEVVNVHVCDTSCAENCVDLSGWTDTRLHTSLPRTGHPRYGDLFDDILPHRLAWLGSLTTSWQWRFTSIADIVDLYYVVPRNPAALPGEEDYNLWELPIVFRLQDMAGNVTVREIRVLVDPDANLPVTTITSHYDGQMVAGPITIAGTAQANEILYNVEMRILKQSDADVIAGDPPSVVYVDWTEIADGAGSSFISWIARVNESGDLDPPVGADRRLVLVEFRSRGATFLVPALPDNIGRVDSVFLHFDNTAPVIHSVELFSGRPTDIGAEDLNNIGGGFPGEIFDVIDGSLISGFATMRVIVRAPAGFQAITVRSGNLNVNLLDGVTRTINNVTPWLSSRRPHGPYDGDEFTLFIPLNTNVAAGDATATTFASGFMNAGAAFFLELHLADLTTPTPFLAQSTYTLRIDNRHPLGRYTGALKVIDSIYDITGEAWDHGSGVGVHGIEKLYVFFSRPGAANDGFGSPVTLTGGSGGAWVTREVMTGHLGTPTTITQQGSLSELPFFPDNFSSSGTGIYMESTPAGWNTSGGFFGGMGAGPVHGWFISDFDFAGFDDGPLTINYVVVDHAGNATYFSEDIFLAINRPVIQTVHLSSDVGAGNIFTPRSVPHEPLDADFRVRNNNLSVRLNVTTPLGNPFDGSLDFDVAHVTLRSPSPIPAAQMVEGGVYRVATRGTVTGPNAVNWVDYGVLVNLEHGGPGGTPVNPEGITFVATRAGSAANNGTVFAYDIPAPGPRRQQGTWSQATWNAPASTLTFNAPSFAAGQIPDSTPVPQADGVNFYLQHDRLFLVRVTTSPSPGTYITNAALVGLDVHNIDVTPPVINIAHFGYQSIGVDGSVAIPNFANRPIMPLTEAQYNLNIVMTPTNARRGYVQYHWHSDTPRADVSGRVIFRGNAADDNRIASVTARIGGTVTGGATVNGITTGGSATGGVVHTIAHWDTTGLVSSGGDITAMGNPANTAIWGFNPSWQTNTQEYGHVFNWEFAWDTSRFPEGMVRDNVPITFTVTDTAGLSMSRTIRVNIVPYITEIVTPLSDVFSANPSAFNRSARGWYPAREGDIITIRGFNLGGTSPAPGATNAATSVTLAGTTLTIVGAPTSTALQVNIGTTAVSGPLVVTVTPTSPAAPALTSINNRSNLDADYNWEPNNLNNNTLTNRRYMYVWQTGFLLNAPVVTGPIMRMQSDSTWLLAYGRWGPGPIGDGPNVLLDGLPSHLRVLRSDGVSGALSDNLIQQFANRYLNVAMAVDEANDWYIASSNMTVLATTPPALADFSLFARNPTFPSGAGVGDHGTNHRALSRLTGGVNRFRAPSVFAQSTSGTFRGSNSAATRVLVGFWDSTGNDNPLFLSYGLVGDAGHATQNFGGNFSNTSLGFGTTLHLFPPVVPAPGAPGMPQIIATNSTAHSGSEHVAVGALANGVPVVAWFDRINNRLVFSHGNAVPSATAVTNANSISNNATQVWQDNARVIQNFAGPYVSMVVDGYDVVHLAYFDHLNGGLFYARIYNPAGTDATRRIYVARVDTHLSAGTRGTINVRRQGAHYVPYISYFHASFSGTQNSIRVAWLRPAANGSMSTRQGTFGGNLNLGSTATQAPFGAVPSGLADSFTGEWEVMTVPASRTPLDPDEGGINLVTIGVPVSGGFFAPTNSGGQASPLNSGWAAGVGRPNRSLRYSLLVGYMTTDFYEGAVLKHTIWQ